MDTDDRTADRTAPTRATVPAATEQVRATRMPRARPVLAGGLLSLLLAGSAATIVAGRDEPPAQAPAVGTPTGSELTDAERSMRQHLDAARDARRAQELTAVERRLRHHIVRPQ